MSSFFGRNSKFHLPFVSLFAIKFVILLALTAFLVPVERAVIFSFLTSLVTSNFFILSLTKSEIVLTKFWFLLPYRRFNVPLDSSERVKVGYHSDKPDSNWLGLRDKLELTENLRNDVYASQDPRIFFSNPRKLTPLGFRIREAIEKQIAKRLEEIPQSDRDLLKALRSSLPLAEIRQLIESGANVRATTLFGRTTLHYAAQFYDNPSVVKYFLEKGIDVDAVDHFGETALMLAIRKGKLGPGRELLLTNPTVSNLHGQNALHLCALSSSAEIKALIPELIKSGVMRDVADCHGNLPLHYAAGCAYGNPEETLCYFLGNSAPINQKNRFGRTPLHFAAKAGLDQSIKTLLNVGANPLLRDKDGNLAGEIASILSGPRSFSP